MGRLELVLETEHISIYSPKYDGEALTEFERFMSNNRKLSHNQLRKDFESIIAVIKKMADDCGARENLFRLEGGNIKAIPLFIEQKRKKDIGTIRLYCIRFSNKLLVIGNGGIKTVNRFEEDPVLLKIVNQLREIEHKVFIATRKKHSNYDDFDSLKDIIETITI